MTVREPALLEAQGLCMSYRGVRVLHPVSFRLEAGECLGIAGANGSGKSTLLALLAQARKPEAGRTLYRGRDTAGVQEELIALLGLEGLLKRRLGELSGGMRQRVSIAMALSTGREVLALDEASSGLDEGYREGLLSWMENFLAGGGCAVWCTHLPDELERLCTSCMTLREGRAYWGDGPVPL